MANRKRVKPKSDPSPLGFDVRTELDFCAGGRGGGGIRMTLCSVFSDQDEADLLETCKDACKKWFDGCRLRFERNVSERAKAWEACRLELDGQVTALRAEAGELRMRCAALEEEAHGDSEERQRGAARERELLAQIQQLEEESLETQEATAAALHEYQRNLMLLRDARAANARLERLVSRYKGKKKDLESKIKGMEKKLAAYKAYQWGDGSDLMPRLPGIEPPDVRYGGSRSPGKSVQKSEAMPQGCAKHTSVQDGALLQADATPGCSARGGGPSSEWQDMHGGAIHTTDSGVLPPGASKDPPGLERKPGSRSMASKCCPLLARGEDRACQQRMHAGATGSPDVWAEASAAAANAAISIVQPHELGKHEEPRAPSTAMENGKKRVQVRECECPSVAKAQGPLLPGSGEECQSKGEVEEDVGFVPDSLPMEEAGGDLFEGQPLEPYLSRCRRIGSARPRHSVGTKAVQLTPETAAPEDSEATEPPWESPGSSVGPIAKSPSQPLEMDGLPASQAREVNSINAERQEELTGRGVESKTKAPVGGEQGAPSGLHDSARNLRGCSNIAPPLHRAGQSAALPWHITADADSVARICYEGSVAVWQSDPQGDEAEEVAGAFETQSSAASAPQSARRESVGNPPGTLRQTSDADDQLDRPYSADGTPSGTDAATLAIGVAAGANSLARSAAALQADGRTSPRWKTKASSRSRRALDGFDLTSESLALRSGAPAHWPALSRRPNIAERPGAAKPITDYFKRGPCTGKGSADDGGAVGERGGEAAGKRAASEGAGCGDAGGQRDGKQPRVQGDVPENPAARHSSAEEAGSRDAWGSLPRLGSVQAARQESEAGNCRDEGPSEDRRRAPESDLGLSRPSHKYREVVRKKAEREALPGHTCQECEKFYKALRSWGGTTESIEMPPCGHAVQFAGVTGVAQMQQDYSRHRHRDKPPDTPEGFWDMGFMDSLDSRVQR